MEETTKIYKGIYENDILEYISRFKVVYVYGAGKYGNILVEDLKRNNCKIEAVVVSKKEGNPDEVGGVQVIDLEKLPTNIQALFVIGVSEKFTTEIINLLKEKGHKHILYLENPFVLHGGITPEYEHKTPKLEITASIGCRIQCRYCPQQLLLKEYFKDNKKRISQMNLEDYKTCISHMPLNTIISFAGFVEPFHHPDGVEMILLAHQMGYKVELYTTFDGLTIEQFEYIKDIPFTKVVLHTPDKKNYANIRTTDEYWKILDLALGHRKAKGDSFIDTANCQSEPTEQFLEVARGRVHVESTLVDRAGNLESNEALRSSVYKKEDIYCSRSYRQNHWVLLPDGNVTLCCMDFGLSHTIGSLLNSDYEELLHSERYISIRRQMMNLEPDKNLLCRNCSESMCIVRK